MTMWDKAHRNTGRGAYSAIVYKEGAVYVAEDDSGNLIEADTDAATVIQKAIDDYAEYGLVLVKPTVALSSTLNIQKGSSRVDFLSGVYLATGVNGFKIGDTTHIANYSTLNLVWLNGVDESSYGVEVSNISAGQINWKTIVNCSIGLYFNACSGGQACDNQLVGANMGGFSTAGIRFSTAAGNMEGNHFVTSVYDAPIGFDLLSGGNSRYQTFMGTIDCLASAGSEDIRDARGFQLFLCDFVRRETCTIAKNTVLLNVYGTALSTSILEVEGGSAHLLNMPYTPLLMWDFNRDSTGDWTKVFCTMGTPSKSVTQLTATQADPHIARDIEVDGGQASVIIIRYKYISGDKGQSSYLYYKTSGHDYSSSYYKKSDFLSPDGDWHLMVLDMSDLTAGGTDWIDNTITALRYDYSTGTSVYDIDFISVGTRGYASIYHMDDALKTPASASAQGNKGDIRWDTGYIYICTAKDTWERVAIATW